MLLIPLRDSERLLMPGTTQAAPGTPQPASATPHSSYPVSLLERAILALESHRSLSAKVRHRIDLFGRSLVGSGSYFQQQSGGGLLLRVELKIQVGSEVTSLLQVCDGQYLWTYQRGVQNQGRLSRVALVRVAQALDEAGEMPRPGRVGKWLGLGGLPRLLRGLLAAFHFVAVEEAQLDRRPVWRLRGHWKPEQVARFLDVPGKARPGGPIDANKLPPHLPDQVFVYLDRENLLPLQVEYLRSGATASDRDASPPDRVLVAMELFEPAFNVPIDPRQFIYNPGTQEFTDQTEAYLQGMQLTK